MAMMDKVPVRDVDALLAVGEAKMAAEDRDYLVRVRVGLGCVLELQRACVSV